MIDYYRLKQSSAQQSAIESRGQTKVTRVVDRDSEFGFQKVIAPDGSISRDGIKTYNAEIPIGSPVLATERSDGRTALSSLKATPSKPFQVLASPKLYLEGRVFGLPEPKKAKGKGQIHILYFYEGEYWVGGHQEVPEKVITPTFTGTSTNGPRLWADRAGWIFTYREIGTRTGDLIYSYDSEGNAYSSPNTPNGKFLNPYFSDITGDIGFGVSVFTDGVSGSAQRPTGRYVWHKGVWTFVPVHAGTFPYSVQVPIGILPPSTIITRQVDLSAGAESISTWDGRKVDRDSAIIEFAVEDSFGFSGYFELLTQQSAPQQLYPYSEDYLTGGGTPYLNLPSGMYTDRKFTNSPSSSSTQINNLKSGPGLVTISITGIDRVTTNQTVNAFKIPATANIITTCTTIGLTPP